jgi:hypothetical protein
MYGERSVVAAILTNGLLDAVQPGADSRLAARRVVTLYQAILSELARNNLPIGDDMIAASGPTDLLQARKAISA